MPSAMTANTPFELLELPDGSCYVARPVPSATTLVAGSFVRLELAPDEVVTAVPTDPVGLYASRDEAERAIQRTEPARDPLAPFAAWLRR